MTDNRAISARKLRQDAAELAYARPHAKHESNGDEQRYGSAHYAMSFTKGLEHDAATGLVASPADFLAFRKAIDDGSVEAFTTRIEVPAKVDRRKWEAPTAGLAYDLEGPDGQSLTMAPAPALGSDELAFEMAEVYELALLRDTPLESFDQTGGPGVVTLDDAIKRLNALPYATAGFPVRPRKTVGGVLTRQTAFRGSSPGVDVGPYLSQFLLIGNGDLSGSGLGIESGYVRYGGQLVDQRVPETKSHDFMIDWSAWLDVQRGYDVNKTNMTTDSSGQFMTGSRRFIYTPRDLATYVHFDALYQAYLNACLILLTMKAPFDPSFDLLSGMGDIYTPPTGKKKPNAGGFALFGGPHILSLVTEVATRALKAVRYQKFNTHLRLRPEALAARLEKAKDIDALYPATCNRFSEMRKELDPTITEIVSRNTANGSATALLPMAFAEGSPMHPSYGAGHATVAGACVTILKAYFDTGAIFGEVKGVAGFYSRVDDPVTPIQYTAVNNGATLLKGKIGCPLTLEGELNKLAANIAIGRNMAGVHYFADYYDSLRLGEAIALGILEEQALCYPVDAFVLSVPTFDGKVVRIGRR